MSQTFVNLDSSPFLNKPSSQPICLSHFPMNLTTNFTLSNMTLNISAGEENMTSFERYFYLFNGLAGTFLSVIVLLIAFLHIDTQDKPRHIIVMNMTAADLFTCTIYMLTRAYLSWFPSILCYPYYVVIVSCQLCSCFTLLWINVDKLLFVKRPLHYYTLVSRKRVLLLMSLTWISLIGLILALYSFMNVKHPCDKVELSAQIYLLICVLYIFTISASFASSAIIFCIAHNSRRTGSSKETKRLFKRLFFVFSSTLWTFATCLPYRLFYLGILLSGQSQSPPSPLLHSIVDITYMLLVVGIVTNPLITIITQRIYRQWIFAFFWRFIAIFGAENVPKGRLEKRQSMLSQIGGKPRERRLTADGNGIWAEEGKKNSRRKSRLESVVELDEE